MQKLDLKVADIQQLTLGIKRFEFVNAAGGDLPAFSAGAHIDFHLEKGLIRSYSLANDPSETHRYVTAILREGSGGGGSIYMHDNVNVGDTLTITEPANNFALVDDASQHIMLAGGIGITPLMAMGYHLKAGGGARHLHYCTKSREETAFADTVEELFGDDLTFYHDGGDPSKGINLAETFKDRPDGAHLYICGPGGLLKAAREATEHWPASTVHFELFQSLKTEEEKAVDAAEQHEGDQSFEVELAQTGKTLTIPADKSILEVLWENDIEVMHACEEGWCGNCVVDYLGGGVDHRDEVLDQEEQKTKMQVCISRALPGEKIILDL